MLPNQLKFTESGHSTSQKNWFYLGKHPASWIKHPGWSGSTQCIAVSSFHLCLWKWIQYWVYLDLREIQFCTGIDNSLCALKITRLWNTQFFTNAFVVELQVSGYNVFWPYCEDLGHSRFLSRTYFERSQLYSLALLTRKSLRKYIFTIYFTIIHEILNLRLVTNK